MSAYCRPRIPGSSVFFTACLAMRGDDLLIREVARLRTVFREVQAAQFFRIDAVVILPDHLHCVWTLPEGDCDYSGRWAAIKAGFSRGLPPGRLRPSHMRRREKGIWQRRFWEHHLRSEAEMSKAISYCWTNPVKHGLVGDPAEWPYSSWHRDRGA